MKPSIKSAAVSLLAVFTLAGAGYTQDARAENTQETMKELILFGSEMPNTREQEMKKKTSLAEQRLQPFVEAMDELCHLSKMSNTGKQLTYEVRFGGVVYISTNLTVAALGGKQEDVSIIVDSKDNDKESTGNFLTPKKTDGKWAYGYSEIIPAITSIAIENGFITKEVVQQHYAEQKIEPKTPMKRLRNFVLGIFGY